VAAEQDPAARPSILFNRWQEDWSVLANPSVPRQPLDDLKYLPLASNAYLSLGADLRERFEANDAANFDVGGANAQNYVLSRMEAHGDLRWGRLQAFVQLQSEFAPGKANLAPVDQNRMDLEQAFLGYMTELGDGILRLHAGRQQIAFDSQRFVSVRDGPNIRQSYDALWASYETGAWLFSTFFSLPVQNRDLRAFDDTSSNHLTYGGVRAQFQLTEDSNITVVLSNYKQDQTHFLSVSGTELRNIADVRYAGRAGGLDWDAEWMGQSGHIASRSIRAWAVGSRLGYTFEDAGWAPRLGLQVDAASGNDAANRQTLGTFNPLFPNGSYLTRAGYTGYVNFIHLKPSLTVSPRKDMTVMLAIAAQWRENTTDAVYTQPDNPVPGTAGRGGRYTGTYLHGRMDWQVTPHFTTTLEAVRFQVAGAIRQAGGHDATYLGIEEKFGW